MATSFAPGRTACYTAGMSPELIGIISAGASLAALTIGLFAWLRQDMKDLGKEIKQQGNRLDKEIKEQGDELRKEITEVRKEIKEQGNRLDKEIKQQGEKHNNEITEVKNEITEVKVEVAALRATVETCFRVRVDPPRQAAVAAPPEGYGAD